MLKFPKSVPPARPILGPAAVLSGLVCCSPGLQAASAFVKNVSRQITRIQTVGADPRCQVYLYSCRNPETGKEERVTQEQEGRTIRFAPGDTAEIVVEDEAVDRGIRSDFLSIQVTEGDAANRSGSMFIRVSKGGDLVQLGQGFLSRCKPLLERDPDFEPEPGEISYVFKGLVKNPAYDDPVAAIVDDPVEDDEEDLLRKRIVFGEEPARPFLGLSASTGVQAGPAPGLDRSVPGNKTTGFACFGRRAPRWVITVTPASPRKSATQCPEAWPETKEGSHLDVPKAQDPKDAQAFPATGGRSQGSSATCVIL